MKKSNKGFTLLELLIALTLSVIILGGVYTTFDSVINTKVATEDSYYKNSLLLSARRVVKPDMLQLYDKTLAIIKNPDNDELTFTTNNSIKMEKAFPVVVRYYVEDTYLIREEKSDDHLYEWKLYLMKNVDKFAVQSHNGHKFSDDYDSMDTIIKVSFEVSGHPVTFIAGSGNTSRIGDYTGAVWE